MRGMNSETIDLIATDPPFNKGRDFHATPDSLASGAKFTDRWSWERDVHQEWVDEIQDDWPAVYEVIDAAKAAYGPDMAAFLCWLGVRLLECHRLLKPTGSLYLHIDHTAHAYVKCLLDAIFGSRNFRNSITWKRSGGKSDANNWAVTTDQLLYYVKSGRRTWNKQYIPYREERNYRDDGDGRGGYATSPMHVPRLGNTESQMRWRGYSPADKGNSWRTPTKGVMADYIRDNNLIAGWPHDYPTLIARLEALDEENLISWSGNGVPRLKIYGEALKGIAITDLIVDIAMASGRERTGYPTQKPLALYERIIKASSNEGDMVLDPFCGCATTPIAAERLGREWVGIDIWDGSHGLIQDRLKATFDKQREGIVIPECILRRTIPERTDYVEGETIVPDLRLKPQYIRRPWEKLSHGEIREYLLKAQTGEGGVGCAGCGRVLEPAFMQLDHITPRASGGENHILNRILLCGPCNGLKGSKYTLSGLVSENKKSKWMRNAEYAVAVTKRVRQVAEDVRAHMP